MRKQRRPGVDEVGVVHAEVGRVHDRRVFKLLAGQRGPDQRHEVPFRPAQTEHVAPAEKGPHVQLPRAAGDDLDDQPNRDAPAFYRERARAALDRLDTADSPDPKEIGGIPLPVAIEGIPLSGPWSPVIA